MVRVMSQERRTDRGAGAQAMSTGRNDAARSDENACTPGWLMMGQTALDGRGWLREVVRAMTKERQLKTSGVRRW